MSSSSPQNYTFILRLWRDSPRGPWRIMLQTVDSTRHGFSNLEGLFRFLSGLVEAPPGDEDATLRMG